MNTNNLIETSGYKNVFVRIWPIPLWLLMTFGPSGCAAFDGERNSYLFTWLDVLDKYLKHLSVGF